jgi:hypothetical protein
MQEFSGKTISDNTDWSHVQETINMLYVAVCQIETTLADSNSSVATLTRSFSELAHQARQMSGQVQSVTEISQLSGFKQGIAQTAVAMDQNIKASVQAFQFYDRVCQRLDHVARGLEKVSTIMGNAEQIRSPNAWQQIQSDIKNSYTMEAERIMFEFIMRGGSPTEALAVYRHHFDANERKASDGTEDEIELF